jgi:hypothetical protein
MQSTERATRTARCLNVAICQKAADGVAVEWYRGAGEYCPECGEALAPADVADGAPPTIPVVRGETRSESSVPERSAASTAKTVPRPPSSGSTASATATATATKPSTAAATTNAAPNPAAPKPSSTEARSGATPSPPIPASVPRLTAAAAKAAHIARRARFIVPLRWFWIIAAALVASAALVYAARPGAMRGALADGITVCPVSSAPQLAADLVRGYAAKTGDRSNHLRVGTDAACDIRFSMTPETPDDVIAHDALVAIVNPLNPIARISETELRLIFSGSVHDWSELGMPPGPIVPILPEAGSDEAKALASSLFFGFTIDRAVKRSGSSAAVARAVAGSDSASRNAIGLVAFSQAGSAKVVPLAYLPAPTVASIAAGRYPYTWAIALRGSSARSNAAAAGFLSYARSSDADAIVVKNGLVPHRRGPSR